MSQNSFVVSALKFGPGGTVVMRVNEAAGRKRSAVTLKLNATIAVADEEILMEDSGRAIQTSDNAFQCDLRPYKIKTFKLKLQPYAARK